METKDNWWGDYIYEYDNATLTWEIIEKKRDRQITGVTATDYLDGKMSHVIVLGTT
jgi:hypothetical protein